MCGIIFSERKNGAPVNNIVARRYKNQSHRGSQGFAFVGSDKDGNTTFLQRESEEKDILLALRETLSNRILFHHRYPTSTVNIPSATHPIHVSHKELKHDYYVAHNGVLMNEDELKKEHDKLGYKYTTLIKNTMTHTGADGKVFYGYETETFNDSEAFAIDLARFLEGKKDKIDAKGSIAFIAIRTDKKGKQLELLFGRNEGNPLVVEENNDLFCIKSEGTGVSIEPDMLYSCSLLGDERIMQQEPCLIGQYYARKIKTPTQYNSMGYGYNYDDDDETFMNRQGYVQRADGTYVAKNEALLPTVRNDEFDVPIETLTDEEWKDYVWGEYEKTIQEIDDVLDEIQEYKDSGLPTFELDIRLRKLHEYRDSLEEDMKTFTD